MLYSNIFENECIYIMNNNTIYNVNVNKEITYSILIMLVTECNKFIKHHVPKTKKALFYWQLFQDNNITLTTTTSNDIWCFLKKQILQKESKQVFFEIKE